MSLHIFSEIPPPRGAKYRCDCDNHRPDTEGVGYGAESRRRFWGISIMFRGRCGQLEGIPKCFYKLAEAIKKSANPRANQIAADRIIRYAKIVFTIHQPKVRPKLTECFSGFCSQSLLANEINYVRLKRPI